MGEIAEALRKANQSTTDGNSEAEPGGENAGEAAGVENNLADDKGDIAAALRRAAKEAPSNQVARQTDVSPPAQRDSARELGTRATSSMVPEKLSQVIFHVERHRHLGLRLRTELDQRSIRSLAIVSASRNEGKTIVSCNIAASIASLQSERSVALVDLDLRNPSIARILQVEVPVGIEQVLQGRAKLEETCVPLLEPEFDLYPCAQPHREAHELLVLPALETFIRDLEARYSVVIIDTPPALLVPDSTLIMRTAGGCVAVARAGVTRVHRFTEMLNRLPTPKILGKVLNNVPLPGHSRDEDYYYYSSEDRE